MHSDSQCTRLSAAIAGRSSRLTISSMERPDAPIAEKNISSCSMFALSASEFCEAKTRARSHTAARFVMGAA